MPTKGENMKKPRILWNLFHPNIKESRGNRIIFDAIKDIKSITKNNLYQKYPNGVIDSKHEQELLTSHDLIVFQHPFYWYSSPALMKEWQDKVLEAGFAYPPKLGKALHGKHWLSVITTGGPDWSYRSGGYNNFTMSELLRPFQQTAYLCGMKWVSPFIIHGVLPTDYEEIKATEDQVIEKMAEELLKFLNSYDLDEIHSIEPVTPPHFLN
jgi:glutathione-regulated potassium-efflux system ancillary protein KefG